MLKKNEVIKALANGGHITLSDIYRSATVYCQDGERLDSCRYDTAERIGQMDGYTIENGSAWSFTRYVKRDPRHDDGNPYGLAACIHSIESERDTLHWDEATIAAHLLRSEEVNGCFFNRKMWDAFQVVFPEWPVCYETMRELYYVARATDEDEWAAIDHAARNIRDYAEPETVTETETTTEEDTETMTTETTTATMTREERRAAIHATQENAAHLETIHRQSSSPAQTVAELIGRIGYRAARQTIAQAVNARGDWDGRISGAARAWAATIADAADRETLLSWGCVSDAIHPAHIDQIAQAAAAYDQAKPDGGHRDAQRITWELLQAIAQDNQDRALDACLLAHEAHNWGAIGLEHCRRIIAIYDAWERGWVALEEAEAAQRAQQEQQEQQEAAQEAAAALQAAQNAARTAAAERRENNPPRGGDVLRGILGIINRGGYLYRGEHDRSAGNCASLYDATGATVRTIPAATFDRIRHTSGMTYWALPWGVEYIAAAGSQKERDHENREYCRRISDELDEYASGRVRRCECGELLTLPEDGGDYYRCPHCGETFDRDDLEQLFIWEYLGDALDIEYRCTSDREYRSAAFLVTCGGPNITIDTGSGRVELHWWSESAHCDLSTYAQNAVDDYAEELWCSWCE